MGSNRYGQIGIGLKDYEIRSSPTLIESLCNETVVYIKAGSFHSFAITSKHSVYAWGNGDQGQLGLGSYSDSYQPENVTLSNEYLSYIEIVSIDTGPSHTMMLTKQKTVYCCGDNTFGQLGLPSKTRCNTPTLCRYISENVLDIACGTRHTLFLTDKGELFACGSNKNYELGFAKLPAKFSSNQEEEVPVCSQLPIQITELKSRTIKYIGAGDFSACITSRGELLIWGLPHLHQEGAAKPGKKKKKQRVVVKYEMKDEICYLSIRGKNSVLLDKNGKIWRLGVEGLAHSHGNHHSSLDFSEKGGVNQGGSKLNSSYHSSSMNKSRILQVSSVEGRQVKSISAGNGFTVAVCKDKYFESKKHQYRPFGTAAEIHTGENYRSVDSHTNMPKITGLGDEYSKTVEYEPAAKQDDQNPKATNRRRHQSKSGSQSSYIRNLANESEFADKTSYEYSVSRKGDETTAQNLSKLTKGPPGGVNPRVASYDPFSQLGGCHRKQSVPSGKVVVSGAQKDTKIVEKAVVIDKGSLHGSRSSFFNRSLSKDRVDKNKTLVAPAAGKPAANPDKTIKNTREAPKAKNRQNESGQVDDFFGNQDLKINPKTPISRELGTTLTTYAPTKDYSNVPTKSGYTQKITTSYTPKSSLSNSKYHSNRSRSLKSSTNLKTTISPKKLSQKGSPTNTNPIATNGANTTQILSRNQMRGSRVSRGSRTDHSNKSKSKKRMRRKVSKLMEKLSNQNKILDEAFEENQMIKRENEDLKREVARLRAEASKAAQSVGLKGYASGASAAHLDLREEKMKNQQKQIKMLNKDYQNLSDKLIKYMDLLSKKTAQNKELGKQVDSLGKEKEELGKQVVVVQELREKVVLLEGERDKALAEGKELGGQVVALERSLFQKEGELELLVKESRVAEGEVIQLKKLLSTKDKEILRITRTQEDFKMQVEEQRIRNKEVKIL